MLVTLKQKFQVTIPSKIAKNMGIRIGDKFEIEEKDGEIILKPVIIVPKEQIKK